MERSVTATLVFLQHVDSGFEFLMRSDGTGMCDNLTSLDLFLVDTAEKQTYVVAGLTLIEDLAEHLDTGND